MLFAELSPRSFHDDCLVRGCEAGRPDQPGHTDQSGWHSQPALAWVGWARRHGQVSRADWRELFRAGRSGYEAQHYGRESRQVTVEGCSIRSR